MRAIVKLFLYEEDEKFFGNGPYQLLKKVEELGSLRSAAMQMKMAYSKAFELIKKAEQVLGFALTEKHIGGNGGGGSKLTEQAREFIAKYEQFVLECQTACSEIYQRYFSK